MALRVVEGEVCFESGLPGFPSLRRARLVPWREGSPFWLLQSTEGPPVTFVVAPADAFFPGFAPEIERCAGGRLGGLDRTQVSVLAIVTVGGTAEETTANLFAPVVVNHRNGRAAQVVVDDARYGLRAPLSGSPDAWAPARRSSAAAAAAVN
jgi:flagellar assembly factor FliW